MSHLCSETGKNRILIPILFSDKFLEIISTNTDSQYVKCADTISSSGPCFIQNLYNLNPYKMSKLAPLVLYLLLLN